MVGPVFHDAYVALGSNLADPAAQVQAACEALARLPDSRFIACSALYRTAPVGYVDQPDFINAVVRLATRLQPHELLEALLGIENRFGRVRQTRNGPRVLDLDLLLYDDWIYHEPGLTLPHPRMHERAFVLVPLLELVPDIFIPGRGAARDWLARVADQAIERL